MRKFLPFILLIFLGSSCYAASLNTLSHIQIKTFSGKTRFIASFARKFDFHIFSLPNPNRLVVDLSKTRLKAKLPKNFKNQSLIKSIKPGFHKNHLLRLVLYVKQPFIWHFYTLKPYGRLPYRLVVDLSPKGKITPQKSTPTKSKEKAPKAEIKIPPLRNAVVVIDPGHGGKDPGATGFYGTHEKNVVLAIGKNLDALLKKEPGITPKMTRTGDYFVTLRNRLRIARQNKADLFMAIHADAFKDRKATGASVFALSQRGATSEAARWLAQKENYSELMGGVNLDDKSRTLRSVLIDLSQTATIRSSLQYGHDVVNALEKVTSLHRDRVDQAPFVVLKSPDIPSLLVETGFISNRAEEGRLRSSWYQHKIAHALMVGIVRYLHQHPPAGTYLAVWKKRAIDYRVKSEDSLAKIAAHFRCPAKKIISYNELTSTALKIGQILQIPEC